MQGIVPDARLLADVWLDGPNLTILGCNERKNDILSASVLTGRTSRVVIPLVSEIDSRLMSRFLDKVAIEVLTQRIIAVDGWQQEIAENRLLDKLRAYARAGSGPLHWPYSRRHLYGENNLHQETIDRYQILHEYDLLYTDTRELYLFLCIFGEEFAINFA